MHRRLKSKGIRGRSFAGTKHEPGPTVMPYDSRVLVTLATSGGVGSAYKFVPELVQL